MVRVISKKKKKSCSVIKTTLNSFCVFPETVYETNRHAQWIPLITFFRRRYFYETLVSHNKIRVFWDVRLSTSKGKGKAVPLQACAVPRGSRRLRPQDLLTSAHEYGKDVSLTKHVAQKLTYCSCVEAE